MYPETLTSSAATLPMSPLSGQWPAMYANGFHPSHTAATASPITTSTSTSQSNTTTSLEITIVTTEQAPNGVDGSTTTIERKVTMRIALPPSYSTKQLKSLNVKIHQDAPAPTTSPVAPVSSEQPTPHGNYLSQGSTPAPVSVPSSSSSSSALSFHEYNHNNSVEAQQLLRQKQLLHLYQAAKNQDVLPAKVCSSQGCVGNIKKAAIISSMPRPEAVSSSALDSPCSFPGANHDNKISKKRRRSTRNNEEALRTTRNNEEARNCTTTATQSSRRKIAKSKL